MMQSILASSIVLTALILFTLILYGLLNMRKIKARKQYFKDLHQELKAGQNVIFSGGLRGTLTRVGSETVDVKVKSGTIIEVSRYAISEIYR